MDLFEASQNSSSMPDHGLAAPLAERLRPKNVEEYVGQKKLFRDSSPLQLFLEQGIRLPNLIFWGPPGTGKTSLAFLLSQRGDFHWVAANAIDTGAKKLRELGAEAHHRKVAYSKPTILFIDEIHRLNRGQQDVLLPFCEKGDFTLIGATTENPGYEVNKALLSRCKVLVFEPLSEEELTELSKRACQLYNLNPEALLTPEAMSYLNQVVAGDARKYLQVFEGLLNSYHANTQAAWPLSLEALKEGLDDFFVIPHDRASDSHYDCLSAFIKSIRGSDADAGLYYLARMLAGGEDPRIIARRLVILASEDIGNADPRALSVAVAGFDALEKIGLPEGAINLAQVVTYLSCAPKSNRSYLGLKKAQEVVRKTGPLPIPAAFRSSQTDFAKQQGFGEGYKYSHDYPRGFVNQDFLPEAVQGEKFYEPSERGFEKNIREYLAWLKQSKPTD